MRIKLAPAILIPTALAMFIAIAIGMSLSALSNMRMVSQLLSSQQNDLIEAISTVQAGSVKFGKMEPIQAQMDDLAARPENGLAGAVVFDATGKNLLNYPEANASTELLSGITERALASDTVVTEIVGDLHMAMMPIRFGKDNALVGTLGIAWDLGVNSGAIIAEQTKNLMIGLGVGAAALLGLALLLMRHVTKPIAQLTGFATELSQDNLDAKLPDTKRKDEIGDLIAAMRVFHQNALKVRELTAAGAEQTAENERMRRATMVELQQAFGNVVQSAEAGDLSVRVDANFSDPELNNLSESVNQLVGTMESVMREAGDVLSALAEADLTQRMTGSYEGEFARLKNATNTVAENLTDIVTRLRGTSMDLKTATTEILSGANDLSERTTRQAATIEETSATMEQLAQTVMANAERAVGASENAGDVTKAAEDGGVVMHRANEAMERITSSSAKISNIIGMIDDIAFQTNLLALNASVEAARAGEAGKGFAVVAVEVRRLAQSAAEASSEVKALIEQSANEVSTGSKLVADAASKLEAMLEAVRRNREQLDGIARDSREQASSIDEVNTAVRQMDEMTQHNAALVEEINAAIEQTEAQATELDKIVTVFSLDAQAGRSSKPAEARKPAPLPAASVTESQPVPAQKNGIRALQDKVKSAASAYLTRGNAAVKTEDWTEF